MDLLGINVFFSAFQTKILLVFCEYYFRWLSNNFPIGLGSSNRVYGYNFA